MLVKHNDIVEPKLSYEILSILFKIHNVLGNQNQEKHYQRAIALELKKRKIEFEQEKYVPILYEGQMVGKYFLDFVINNSVIIETKTVPVLTRSYQNQIMAYMRQLQIKLGILANFRTPRLTYQRLILPEKYITNIKIKKETKNEEQVN